MDVKASAKFVRMSPRKVRLVVDTLRRAPAARALEQLRFVHRAAATPVRKLLLSAVANAQHNYQLERGNLLIKEITVTDAPTLKRWLPRAHGRATTLRLRACHIFLTLSEIKDSGEKTARRVAAAAPVKIGEQPPAEPEPTTVSTAVGAAPEREADHDIENSQRSSGRGGRARAEGGRKGFSSKMFRRKSG